jgi:hypothetical protein
MNIKYFQCDPGKNLFYFLPINPALLLNTLSEGAENQRGRQKREGCSCFAIVVGGGVVYLRETKPLKREYRN